MGWSEHATAREHLIGEIYRAHFGAIPRADVLNVLVEQTHSDKALWGSYNLKARHGEIFSSLNVAPEYLEMYNSGLSRQNIWFARPHYFQAEGLIWPGSRIVPPQDLESSDFFKAFLAPQHMYHTLHIVVSVEPHVVTHVTLTRPFHEPDFGSQEVDLARCFALHARRAGENRAGLANARIVETALAHVLEDAGFGIAVLNPPEVIYASKTCLRLLDSLGAPTAQSMSKPGSPRLFFPRVIAEAISSESTRVAVLERPSDGGRVLVSVKQIHVGGDIAHARQKGVIVAFFDLNQSIRVDEDLLRRAYDLTASEAKVCSLLANGKNVEDLSERLCISPNTARTHIKRILSKTGATRQAGLVRLVLNTVALHRNAGGLESREPPRARAG
jgi:DNA-binding CsgD family transcriptional regulator